MPDFNEPVTVNGPLTVDGNVGIGTTEPEALLHIRGRGGTIRLTDGAGSTGKIDVASGNLYIASNDPTRTDLFIGSNGSVGIGTTTPRAKLEVAGSGPSLLSIVSHDGESDIRYKSADRREWQVGTGWDGATGGPSAFFWYWGGGKMALTSGGDLHLAGSLRVGRELTIQSRVGIGTATARPVAGDGLEIVSAGMA